MKTVILGGGALGSIIAAHLCNAGHQVSVVAREPRASLLAREGIRITGLVDTVARVPVITDVSSVREADLVINALKTYQSAAVLKAMRLDSRPVAFSVQNGVYKNTELAAVFGQEQVLGATAMISGEVLPDGATRFTTNESLSIGELSGADSARSREIAGMLKSAGINAVVAPDIKSMEWSKYVMFVPVFCLALIARQETHRFLSHPRSAAVMAALAREMAQLASAEGVPLSDSGSFSVAALARVGFEEAVQAVRGHGARMGQAAPTHKVSGLQDLERGRATEVEEIAGYALRRSLELGLRLPTLRTCYHLCSAISPVPAEAPA